MIDALRQLFGGVSAGLLDPIFFALGVMLLVFGGKVLVDGAIILARRLNLSTLLIGLTVVAFGTSLPELAFNVAAAADDATELAFGNIIGSNIANIGLVLGFAVLLGPIVVHSRIVSRELPWLVVCTLSVVGLGWLLPHTPDALAPQRGFALLDGLLMLAMLAFFLLTWLRLAVRDANDPLIGEVAESAAAMKPRPLWVALLLVVIGAVMLALGAEATEAGAVGIARLLGVSEQLIGLTIVALCTSLPELMTTLIAARRRQADLVLGNIIGSNIFNLLLILAVTCVISPVPVPARTGWYDLAFMLGMTIFIWPICTSRSRIIGRVEGAALVGAYMGYMFWRTLVELQ
jgi:cation:H+ antiporter